MPGLTGFIGEHITSFGANSFTLLSNKAVKEFQDEKLQLQISAIKTDIGYQYLETEQYLITLIGDLFSFNNQDSDNPLQVLLEAYKNGQLAESLAQANGYFSILIYDKVKQSLSLACDRYGIKPLYIAEHDSQFQGFSSEIKSLILNNKIALTIDAQAVEIFCQLGHMLNQQTWFEGIKRIPPATLCEVDLNTGKIIKSQYWSWAAISIDHEISFEEATDKLYLHFDNAMRRCLSYIKQPNLAVTLSGGLDSRVILAAAKKHFSGQITTFTFGNPDCDDAIIAKTVAKVAKVENTLRTISHENWFEGRESGIWQTDGMFNVLHMHALGSVKEITLDSNYLLNGYLGDAVLGGSYLLNNHLDQGISEPIITERYPALGSLIDINPNYFGKCKHDPALIYNRGVRFIATGTDLLSSQLHNLKPFMDTDLLDFCYSLPDSFRANSCIYNAMLLKYYPEYFESIPWQQTGKPISIERQNDSSMHEVPLKRKLINLIKSSPLSGLAYSIFRKINYKKNYTAYTDWMQKPEFKNKIDKLLLQQNSPIHKYVPEGLIRSQLANFYKNKPNNAENIGALLTFSIYLNQIEKYRNLDEA
ncbi:asparagine synthetase B family protein [Shewanella sp. Scap07]|uniref:asparagine synthase-related protein n=1 Tax=Shewanella sp. Scap07 TaxID=2589987 RepID=UPI0015BB4C0E|nr:asparagine synthase-related protein [Shewanella sp. Scap07]QLE86063.1 asparagine synthetase B family protein [Shewanella sp. Scap07]